MNDRTVSAIEKVAGAVGLVVPMVPAFTEAIISVIGLFKHPPKREDGRSWSPDQIAARITSDAEKCYQEAAAEKDEWAAWRDRTNNRRNRT